MDCYCYHCNTVFLSFAAREIHILHYSSLPPYPQRRHFLQPPQPPTPESFYFTLGLTQFPDSTALEIDIDQEHSPRAAASNNWIFTMDPSPIQTPTLETTIEWPNPFIDSHTPSPRVFPEPYKTLPTVPTIHNWGSHVITNSCTDLGEGCSGGCVPGQELAYFDSQSRFPLHEDLSLESAIEEPLKHQRTKLPSSPLTKVKKSSRSSPLARPTKKIEKKKKKSKREMRYKTGCPVCHALLVELEKHMAVHKKEMRWGCKYCGEQFPRKKWWVAHEESCGK